MEAVSIVIADTQYLIRFGLNKLIQQHSNFQVVAQSVNEVDLLQKVKAHQPNVVILDYNQPDSFSVDTIAKVKIANANTRILVISSDSDKRRIDQVLEEGVNCFLTKCCDEREIFGAINASAKGEKYFCNNVLNYLLEKSFPKEDNCDPVELSSRELEIVILIAKGYIAKEIASELNLSTHTVYTHRKNIMKKLQLTSTSELVLYAVNRGLIAVGN